MTQKEKEFTTEFVERRKTSQRHEIRRIPELSLDNDFDQGCLNSP
jgi:hypothetical protein